MYLVILLLLLLCVSFITVKNYNFFFYLYQIAYLFSNESLLLFFCSFIISFINLFDFQILHLCWNNNLNLTMKLCQQELKKMFFNRKKNIYFIKNQVWNKESSKITVFLLCSQSAILLTLSGRDYFLHLVEKLLLIINKNCYLLL